MTTPKKPDPEPAVPEAAPFVLSAINMARIRSLIVPFDFAHEDAVVTWLLANARKAHYGVNLHFDMLDQRLRDGKL